MDSDPTDTPCATVHLRPEAFGERERPLLDSDGVRASGFRFDSGVAGLRLANELGEIVMLPFQGQQLWSAGFLGRELTMRSMFDEPQPTRDYLATYGGFLLHCGVAAMGVPDADDSHPLHGELPNAPYREVRLTVGHDARGAYLAASGTTRHTVAFQHDHEVRPTVRMRPDSALLEVDVEVRNRKRSPMALMYLAHANFRPVDGGELVYSAVPDAAHVRVRRSVPAHLTPPEGYRELLAAFAADPARHHRLTPELRFDPEVVFLIDYLADAEGWAHTLQLHPDGSADVLRHRPAELGVGVRWISRTPDQDALGMVLPATAGPEGYRRAAERGELVTVPAGGRWRCGYRLGALAPADAAAAAAHARALVAQAGVGAGAGAAGTDDGQRGDP